MSKGDIKSLIVVLVVMALIIWGLMYLASFIASDIKENYKEKKDSFYILCEKAHRDIDECNLLWRMK